MHKYCSHLPPAIHRPPDHAANDDRYPSSRPFTHPARASTIAVPRFVCPIFPDQPAPSAAPQRRQGKSSAQIPIARDRRAALRVPRFPPLEVFVRRPPMGCKVLDWPAAENLHTNRHPNFPRLSLDLSTNAICWLVKRFMTLNHFDKLKGCRADRRSDPSPKHRWNYCPENILTGAPKTVPIAPRGLAEAGWPTVAAPGFAPIPPTRTARSSGPTVAS
jgi:hypothetical protein